VHTAKAAVLLLSELLEKRFDDKVTMFRASATRTKTGSEMTSKPGVAMVEAGQAQSLRDTTVGPVRP